MESDSPTQMELGEYHQQQHDAQHEEAHENDAQHEDDGKKHEKAVDLKKRSGRKRNRVQLTADHLCVHAGEKQLLFEVTAEARSGALLAVMGPSGSGKTTFMNTISGRMPITSGSISMNGGPVSTRIRKSFGYVTQTDVFFPNLTLRQTVQFAARVKLPQQTTAADRENRIKEVIASLQLEKCMDTVIGNFMVPGLSGGEKKRANVACEMLSSPDVLLLDEPTSGLDSSLAASLIDLIRQWSVKEQKVVIMSIHQPSSQLFHEFEDLLLLTDGHTSYFGLRDGMVDYFEGIGVPFEPHWNAADYMLEVVKQTSEHKQLIIEKGAAFSELQRITDSDDESHSLEKNGSNGHSNGDAAIQMHTEPGSEEQGVTFNDAGFERVSWSRQLLALTIRGFQLGRKRFLSPEPIIRTSAMGVIAALIWFQITRTEDNIRNILGCIFFLTTNLSFAPLFEAIFSFFEDLQVVRHERRAGMYQIGAYYVAKMLTEMPLTMFVPLLTLTLVFWVAGLGGILQYLPFVVAILFNSLACQGIGSFFGLLFDFPKANITCAFVFMMSSLLLGGFFATAIPVWLVWLKYLSFIRYCFHFCMLVVFENSPNFLCTQSSRSSYPACINGTIVNAMNQTLLPPQQILAQYPDDFLPVWGNFGIILVFLVVFRIAGYLWLRFMKKV